MSTEETYTPGSTSDNPSADTSNATPSKKHKVKQPAGVRSAKADANATYQRVNAEVTGNLQILKADYESAVTKQKAILEEARNTYNQTIKEIDEKAAAEKAASDVTGTVTDTNNPSSDSLDEV